MLLNVVVSLSKSHFMIIFLIVSVHVLSTNDVINTKTTSLLLTNYLQQQNVTYSLKTKKTAQTLSYQLLSVTATVLTPILLNLSKTWEMVIRRKTRKPLPEAISNIQRKSELKLLGVTFNKQPCNWDTHFDHMLGKASSRLYILRVCKYYGYSREELTTLFDSLIMSLFTYAIEVWACAYDGKYLAQIDKFCKRAEKYGYTNKQITIGDIIRNKDRQLLEKITTKNHCLNDLLPTQEVDN